MSPVRVRASRIRFAILNRLAAILTVRHKVDPPEFDVRRPYFASFIREKAASGKKERGWGGVGVGGEERKELVSVSFWSLHAETPFHDSTNTGLFILLPIQVYTRRMAYRARARVHRFIVYKFFFSLYKYVSRRPRDPFSSSPTSSLRYSHV